ncbi:hypothetical protein AAG747_19845 [Rapidithrix thailandica]|uniref:Capsule assembly protein Wzi n=1 Tax=Rapidithrix thailandica TaxID=413964 RepID=A0AAW9SCK0_9BACT
MKKLTLLFLMCLGSWGIALGQSALAPLNTEYYHLIDRYEIKQGTFSKSFHSYVKPYHRKAIVEFIEGVQEADIAKSKVDQFNLEYLLSDSWEWTKEEHGVNQKPFLKHFYKRKPDLYHVNDPDFDLHINPVLYFSVGKDNQLSSTPYINSRGLELRGNIGKKVGFYSFITDNQTRFPLYVQQEIAKNGAVPGEGFWKVVDGDSQDFFSPRGYITFNFTKQISFQFGHDKNFWGQGYRSTVLSDYSNNYLFAKINTKVWRINYTNLFAKMTANNQDKVSGHYPRKYITSHHLSVDVTDHLNIGLFETIVFSRQDSLGNNHFEPDYLNPIIFYRAVEHDLGDPDNVLIGMDFKWNLMNRFQLYGQYTLDELLVDVMVNGNGDWKNKFAGQLGGKYIDAFGVSNLDLQLEFNAIRPYMYSHKGDVMYQNYQHFTQPLAHPKGANLLEYVGIIRYQPLPRLSLKLMGMYTKTGEDGEGENWGADLSKDYNTRQQDVGNTIGQGISTKIAYVDLNVSYMLFHNLFLDFQQTFRNFNSEDDTRDLNTSFTNFSLRWNIPQRRHEF